METNFRLNEISKAIGSAMCMVNLVSQYAEEMREYNEPIDAGAVVSLARAVSNTLQDALAETDRMEMEVKPA